MGSAEKRERNVFIFEWKIEKFIFLEKISSPIFFVHSIDSSYTLELSYNGSQLHEGTIGFYLLLALNCSESTEIDFELSCLDSNSSALISRKKLEIRLEAGKRHGFLDFMLLDDIINERRLSFLPQGTLTLQCKIWKSNGEMSESAVCFARSRVGIERSSFIWPIKGFSELMLGGTITYSVRKASQGNPTLFMNLQLVNVSNKVKEFLLELSSGSVQQIAGKDLQCKVGKVSVYDFKLSFLNVYGAEKVELNVNNLECCRNPSFEVLVTEELMKAGSGYIVNDALLLKFQFMFYVGIVSEEIEHTVSGKVSEEILKFRDPPAIVQHHNGYSKAMTSLRDIWKFLYDTSMFYDVSLVLGFGYIFAHKSILSAKSPVFQSIFEESQKDTFIISDVNADVFREMILYIYTDTLYDIQLERVYQLFVSAEKYKVISLKKRCYLLFIAKLDKNNACDILRFAEKQKDTYLLHFVNGYILEGENENISSAT